MGKKEFHYTTAGDGVEYSFKFEIQSLIGRSFFSKSPPLKNGYCNLGCGHRFLDDYVNSDFFQFNILRTFLNKPKLNFNLDWELDMRFKIKCKNNFFEGIFLEHVIEHLKINDAIFLLKELFRILKPGGTLRISVPDLEKYISFYNKKKVHKKFLNWKNIPSEALWSLNHNFGHQSAYDFQLLSDLLLRAGFKEFRKCSFNMSKDPKLRVDDIGRSWESLYIDASK
tara:strand:+ start:422 stop:1099 length:678 start_codon:yes stop_codon:yes gene_type:complete